MKAVRKFLYTVFALVMVTSLFACAPAAATEVAPTAVVEAAPTAAPVENTEAAPTEAPAAAAQLTADGRYPLNTIKICVETFDPADAGYMGVQDYFKFLSENVFNVEFIYSEKIESAEQELQFIENCGAAGAKGFVAYYNVSKGQAVAKAAELEMYYWGIAEEKDVYEEYKANPYYLGSVINGNGDYDGMYAVTKALLESGRTKFVYANGGADFGVAMFIDRRNGFMAAIDEAKAAGATITVNEVPGFPNEAWFAAQGAALAGDLDVVVSSFGPEIWIQPISAGGKAESVTIGSFGAISPSSVDLYKQMYAGGLFSAIATEPTERFGIGIAQIVNAVDGNADALKDNGVATNAAQSLWIVTSPEAYDKVSGFEMGDGRAQYSKGLVNLVKNLNPDASYTTLLDLIKAYELDAILAGK